MTGVRLLVAIMLAIMALAIAEGALLVQLRSVTCSSTAINEGDNHG